MVRRKENHIREGCNAEQSFTWIINSGPKRLLQPMNILFVILKNDGELRTFVDIYYTFPHTSIIFGSEYRMFDN